MWLGSDTSANAVQLRSSTGEKGLKCGPLCRVDGKPILELHLDHPFGEPGAVVGRHPLGGVPSTLLRAVDGRVGDREVVEVARDGPSPIVGDSTVVSLSQSYDVLDISRSGPVPLAVISNGMHE